MKVKLSHYNRHGSPGDVVDLPDGKARQLVSSGHARYATEHAATTDQTSSPQTAGSEPQTAAPEPRRRRGGSGGDGGENT